MKMENSAQIKRFGEHRNAFGFLRLLFASLVIVSHTPELVDGNRSRELLTRVFGTISFGELAVDCFFLVSGYLIVGSYIKLPNVWPFLKKRVARIYPAFILASILCVTIVAPLGGASLVHAETWIESAINVVLLHPPVVPGSFTESYHPALNDAMWTIAYEFRCYMLVLALGLLGTFHRPQLIVALSSFLLILYQVTPDAIWERGWGVAHLTILLGYPAPTVRLTGIYLMGCTFYLYRDSIKFTRVAALISAGALFGCMFVPGLAEPAVATFGAYLVFAFARSNTGFISQINDRNDISYGVYLYAWPVEKLLIWYFPWFPLLLLGLLTFMTACVCGWISWQFIEKPVMRRLR